MTKEKLRPLGDRLTLKKIINEQVGIIAIPEQYREWPDRATVLTVGVNCKSDIKVGDTVYFKRHSGTDVEFNNEKLFILKETEVFAIIQ